MGDIDVTESQDTTRAALRHDSEAMPSAAADTDLDQAADRMLADLPLDDTGCDQPGFLTDPEDDPVYRMGAQLGRLVARHSLLDHQSVGRNRGAEKQKRDREFEMSDLDRRADFLRDAATYHTASSLPGALAHLVVGSQFLSDLLDQNAEDSEVREGRVKAVRRCLYSVVHVLAAVSGVSPRAFGSDYSMAGYLDEMTLAMAPADGRLFPTAPKPTVDDSLSPSISIIERQLADMNRRAEIWWSLYDEAGRMEDENSHNPDNDPLKRARHKMGDMAESHARRRWRELLRRAIALPATTPRELGLQARLIAIELDEWWDSDDDLGDGEIACRLLLDRLAAFAGLPRIERPDVEPAEIQDWLDRPEEHAKDYCPELRK